MNGREVISQAMTDLAVLAAGEVPSDGEIESGLVCLNQLADSLGLDKLMLYKTVRTTKTLASGTASYTIGSSGSINLERPAWIDRAGLVLDTGASEPIEVPIRVLNDDEYADWPMKTQQLSRSSAIWYDRGFSSNFGLIYPLPIPDVATTQLVLYTPGGHIAELTDVDTDIVAPRGYGRALRKLLALELAPQFPAANVSPLLLQQAKDAKAVVRNANVRRKTRSSSPGLVGGGGYFDIEGGGYR